MSDQIIGNRGRQILQTLYENGPLSSATLRAVIEPPIKIRRLNAAIKRLRDIGLIRNRHSSISHYAGRFIELAQGRVEKSVLSKLLNVPATAFEPVSGGTEALEHWQECTVWAKHFRAKYPDGLIIRDFQISKDETSLKTLLVEKTDIDLIPDMILRLPTQTSKKVMNIGIEIERTQKSKRKLMMKLRKLSSRTRLDGVIYICSRPNVANKLVRVYNQSVKPNMTRVSHYADQFLITSDGSFVHGTNNLVALDATNTAISVEKWIHFLRTHEMSERKQLNVTPRANDGSR